MRRFRWLPWLSSSVVVAGTSLLLSPAVLKAESLDESKVKNTLMQRFDENRNDKLDSGEARQARARLRNLLEDKSEREINILTWRDDVRELLQSLDSDSDNRLDVSERDAGRDLLDRLIPAVESTAPKERETSNSSLPKKEKEKDSKRENDRSRRTSGGSASSYGSYGSRYFGNAMGGGGFGSSGNYLGGTSMGNFATGGSVGSIGGVAGGSAGMSGAGSEMGMGAMSGMRPGLGDPGSSIGGAMASGMGTNAQNSFTGSMSGFGTGGFPTATGVGQPSGSNTINPSGTALGNGSTPPTQTQPMPSGQGPLGDTQSESGVSAGTTPGNPTASTNGTPGGGLPEGMTPTSPDGLGGGMAPPTTGGPSGPDGATTVPFNPMPNF